MDLPLPKKVQWTPQEADEKSWRTLATVNLLLALYAAVHKVLVPWIVQDYVDPWVIYHFVLAFFLYRRDSRTTVLVSWLGLGFCLSKLAGVSLRIFGGASGWSSISTLMTESFSALFLLYLLYVRRRLPLHEISFATVSGLMLGMVLHLAVTETVSQEVRVDARPVPKNAEVLGCEATVKDNTLEISSCGLKTAELEVGARLTLKNNSGKFLNLRIEQTAPSTGYKRNVPLFESRSFVLETRELEPGSRLLVRSDSRKDIGPLVLVVKKEVANER